MNIKPPKMIFWWWSSSWHTFEEDWWWILVWTTCSSGSTSSLHFFWSYFSFFSSFIFPSHSHPLSVSSSLLLHSFSVSLWIPLFLTTSPSFLSSSSSIICPSFYPSNTVNCFVQLACWKQVAEDKVMRGRLLRWLEGSWAKTSGLNTKNPNSASYRRSCSLHHQNHIQSAKDWTS